MVAVQNALSARTHTRCRAVVSVFTVVMARSRCQPADVPERVGPRRSEHSAITGADDGVDTVTSSAFKPRIPE